MTPREPKLDATLVWDDDGCLAEPAIHALADGEVDVLPEQALVHAETCEGCADKIGSMALFSLEVAEAIAQLGAPGTTSQVVRAQPRANAMRRPVPVAPLSLALVVAFVAILPNLNTLAPQFMRMQAFSAVAVPLLAQLTARALTRAAQSGLLVSVAWSSAGLLLLGGVAIARVARTRPTARGNS